MRTIEEVIAELRKDIHSDVYLGNKTISTYLDEILEIHKAESTQGEWVEEIIEELESRKDYGTEYAQAMEDVITILKAKFGIDKDGENE